MKDKILTFAFRNPHLDLRSKAKDDSKGNQHCRNIKRGKDKEEKQ